MAKAHINPKTLEVGKCSAEIQCPFGGEENHFHTLKEAREESARRAKDQAKNEFKVFKKQEAKALGKHLAPAVEWATKRGNVDLAQKLEHATEKPIEEVLSKPAQDAAFNHHKVLKTYEYMRTMVEKALNETARHGDFLDEKLRVDTPAASYSLSVSEKFNQDEFEALPKRVQDKLLSGDGSSLSIDAAREHLTKEQFDAVTTKSRVLDVIGNDADENDESVKNVRDMLKDVRSEVANGKATTTGQLTDILERYAKDVEAYEKLHGSKKSATELLDGYKATIKEKSPEGTEYFYTDEGGQGFLTSNRLMVDKKKAAELLDEATLAKITVAKDIPDEETAKSLLTVEQFNKVFRSPTVRLTVREKKAK